MLEGRRPAALELLVEPAADQDRAVGGPPVHHHQRSVGHDLELGVRLGQRHVGRRERQQRVHRLTGARLGTTADQDEPLDAELLAGVEGDPPARPAAGRRSGRRPRRAVPAGVAGVRPAGSPRRAASRAAGAAVPVGPARAERGGRPTRRDEPHRRQVDDRAQARRRPRPRAPVGGRTSTTHDRARRSCQPRRRPPGSATAVHASAATPNPNVGTVASPRMTERSRARGNPIGPPSSARGPAGRAPPCRA